MVEVLKKFFDFCGSENKKKFYMSIGLGVLMAFLEALRIPASYVVIKAMVEGNSTAMTAYISLGILLISIILTIIVKAKTTMLQTEAGYNTCANKRIEIAEHMRYLPMGYFNENSLGYITSVTTNTMEVLAEVATKVVMMTTQGLLTTLLITCMMFTFDYRLALIVVVGLLIFLLANKYLQYKALSIAKSKDEADRILVASVLEYVQGMSEIKSYSLYGNENKKLIKAIEEASDVNFRMEKRLLPAMALQHLITKAIGVCMAAVSIFFYINDSMELAECIMMLICAFMIYAALDGAGSFSALIRSVNIAVEKANAILEIEPMDTEGDDIEPKNFDIELKNVEFSYDKRKIIDKVSLYIKEGTTTAIVGPSGGGKTTLCRLMARFWDVNEGSVELGGRDVRQYSMDSLMKNFSFVFQNVYLFEDTVANNIKFGNPSATKEEVIEVAKKACCHDFIMKLDKGYDTVIGEGGASLSGGEKQRLSIARAMMKSAPIIILDEATANVDPENEKELMQAIEELTRKKTVIMIAHRLKTVRNADKIVVIDEGRIVQEGKHEELIKTDGIYNKFVNARELAVSWKIS
jgi:ABC superfamily ATP binding cassette transporter, ABC/membrane protein